MKNLVIIITLIFVSGACRMQSRSTTQSEDIIEQSYDITEKYWKLIELNGVPLVFEDSLSRAPYIILKNADNRVSGHGGCNTLTGSYEIDRVSNRIKFSQMASTMMSCLKMENEDRLKKALEMADNYALSADGKFLSLNRARMAPLARFEAIYLN